MSALPVDEIARLLESLDELIATYADPMPGPVVVTTIVRRVLGLGEPTRMSELARAIASVERGAIAAAAITPRADDVLRFADSYIAPELAPALAHALEERSLLPRSRLAMYLVEVDPAAARRLIERIRATRDPDAFVESVANAYLVVRPPDGTISHVGLMKRSEPRRFSSCSRRMQRRDAEICGSGPGALRTGRP